MSNLGNVELAFFVELDSNWSASRQVDVLILRIQVALSSDMLRPTAPSS